MARLRDFARLRDRLIDLIDGDDSVDRSETLSSAVAGRLVRNVALDVVQETEFRRAVIATARVDGVAGFARERANVLRRVLRNRRIRVGVEVDLVDYSLRRAAYFATIGAAIAIGGWILYSGLGVISRLGGAGWDELLDRFTPQLSTVGLVDAAAILVALPFVILNVATPIRRLRSWSAVDDWRDDIADMVRPEIRVALNDYADRVRPSRLIVEEAPALAETRSPDHVVRRESYETVRMLSQQLGAKTIAVAGSRGAGKTTLLRHTCDPSYADRGDPWLRVRVSAPVTYNPREFLIHLYRRLCREVLAHSPLPDRAPLVQRVAATLVTRAFAVVAIIVCSALWISTAAGDPYLVRDFGRRLGWTWIERLGAVPDTALVALVVTIAFALGLHRLAVAVGYRDHARRTFREPAPIATRARDEEQRLQYLEVLTESSNVGISNGRFTLSRGHTQAKAEQAAGLPDLVDAYRSFVADVASWWRTVRGVDGGIMIGIDEIDLIFDPEEADTFLNSLKSIFGGLDCTYVVTVSDEALATFERRLVTVRNAFDSVFDEVVRVPRMTFDESAELLRRRVIGFPIAAIAICHCLSGGIARDLLRVARALVRVRDDHRETHLPRIVPILVDRELAALKRGFADRLSRSSASSEAAELMIALSDPAWPGSTTAARSAAIATVRGSRMTAPGMPELSDDLCTAIDFYSTLADYFSGGATAFDMNRIRPAVIAECLTDGERAVLELIADARESLPISAAVARSRLTAARAAAGFDELPASTPSRRRVPKQAGPAQ